MAPKAGNSIFADQEAEDHAERQGQKVGRGRGPDDPPEGRADLGDRGLHARDREDVHPLQLGIGADRDRHAGALEADDLDLIGARQGAPFLARLLQELAVGDEDLGLVQRHVEGDPVGDLGADQAHLLGHGLALAAERDDVAPLQGRRQVRSERRAVPRQIDDAVLGVRLQEIVQGLAHPGVVLEPVGAQAAGGPARQGRHVAARDAVLPLVLAGRRLGIDAPPFRQVFADQDDADGAPDVGDAVGQRDHGVDLLGRGPGRRRDRPGQHRLLGRADRRRHGLRARQHAAGRAHREVEDLRAEHHEREADDAAHERQEGELDAVAAEAVDEGRPDAEPDAVHEQVVEEQAREVVELELLAVDRAPDRERAADDDGRGDHAEAVAGDRLAPDPDRKTDGREEQDVGIGGEEVEEGLHDGGSPAQRFILAATASAFSSFSPLAFSKPWISFTSSLRMKSIVSCVSTWPGTMIGKPGG